MRPLPALPPSLDVYTSTEPVPAQAALFPVPEAPESPAAPAARGGLTTDGISVTDPEKGTPEKAPAISLWDAPRPVVTAFLLVEDGEPLCQGDRAGVFVDDHGERHDVQRRRSSAVEAVAALMPDEERSEFIRSAKLLFRAGKIPSQVMVEFYRLGDVEAKNRLEYAVAIDAEYLREKLLSECGKYTFEMTRRDADGSIRRVWWRKPCWSHRCPACAKLLGLRESQRILHQLARDEDAGRAPCTFMTVSVDRNRYETSTAAKKDLLRRMRVFIRFLRRRYGKELAYFYAVEFHAEGWPHAHILVRSAGLVRALLESASVKSWATLVDICREAVKNPSGRVRRCPFAGERKLLNEAAVDAGLGRSGFYVEPVRSPEDAVNYIVKENTRLSKSPVAQELTKQTQILDTLPRHFRRFRASGKSGDERQGSFYMDEEKGEERPGETLCLGILHSTVDSVPNPRESGDFRDPHRQLR